MLDDLVGNASLQRSARAGRDDNPLGIEFLGRGGVDLIVAENANLQRSVQLGMGMGLSSPNTNIDMEVFFEDCVDTVFVFPRAERLLPEITVGTRDRVTTIDLNFLVFQMSFDGHISPMIDFVP